LTDRPPPRPEQSDQSTRPRMEVAAWRASADGSPPPADESLAEESRRPVSDSIRRGSLHFTVPQSDALGQLLTSRRLVELFALRNGTLVATFRGAGYRAWRVYLSPDGRTLENSDASEPDPTGETDGPLAIVREADRLHLATLVERPRERGLAPHPDQIRPSGRRTQDNHS